MLLCSAHGNSTHRKWLSCDVGKIWQQFCGFAELVKVPQWYCPILPGCLMILSHYTAAAHAPQSNPASESSNTLVTTNFSKVGFLRPLLIYVYIYIYVNIHAHTFPGTLSLKWLLPWPTTQGKLSTAPWKRIWEHFPECHLMSCKMVFIYQIPATQPQPEQHNQLPAP